MKIGDLLPFIFTLKSTTTKYNKRSQNKKKMRKKSEIHKQATKEIRIKIVEEMSDNKQRQIDKWFVLFYNVGMAWLVKLSTKYLFCVPFILLSFLSTHTLTQTYIKCIKIFNLISHISIVFSCPAFNIFLVSFYHSALLSAHQRFYDNSTVDVESRTGKMRLYRKRASLWVNNIR